MSEYATRTPASNPIMSPVVYWRVSAFALTAVALLGIILSAANDGRFLGSFLEFDWTHNILHVVLAAAAFLFGFANLPFSATKTFAIIFGFVYAGLGVVGFFLAEPIGLNLHLELGENIIHLVLGAWALVAGFGGRN